MTQLFLNYWPLVPGDLRRARALAVTCFKAIGIVHFFGGLLLGICTAWALWVGADSDEVMSHQAVDVVSVITNGTLPIFVGAAYMLLASQVRNGGRATALIALCITCVIVGLLGIATVENVVHWGSVDTGIAGVLLEIQLVVDVVLHVCAILALLDVLAAKRKHA